MCAQTIVVWVVDMAKSKGAATQARQEMYNLFCSQENMTANFVTTAKGGPTAAGITTINLKKLRACYAAIVESEEYIESMSTAMINASCFLLQELRASRRSISFPDWAKQPVNIKLVLASMLLRFALDV
jgi:hypothetical protein